MRRFDIGKLPGRRIEITYPVCDSVRSPLRNRVMRREIAVHSVRDLVTSPLSLAEFLRRPWLMRSRWSVRAYEPSVKRWRQFSLGSSREYRSPGVLRVGVYEHGDKRPGRILGRAFEPTTRDRRLMIDAIREWSRHDSCVGSLRVFADDLGICG